MSGHVKMRRNKAWLRKILQNCFIEKQDRTTRALYNLRGVTGWAGGERKALLSFFHSMSLPEEVDLLHNLRICSAKKKKSSSDTNDYQQLHKFRMSMTPNTDVRLKIIAHRLLQMRKYLTEVKLTSRKSTQIKCCSYNKNQHSYPKFEIR